MTTLSSLDHAKDLCDHGHYEAALAQLEQSNSDSFDVWFLRGKALRFLARYGEAREALGEALLRSSNDPGLEGNVYNELAGVSFRTDNLSTAFEELQRAAQCFGKAGNTADLTRVLTNTGNLYYTLGDYDGALEVLETCISLCEDTNSRAYTATLQNLGNIYFELRDFDEAERMQREAKGIGEKLGIDVTCIVSDNNLGQIMLRKGLPNVAQSYFESALHVSERCGMAGYRIECLSFLGDVAAAQNNYTLAREHHQKALEQCERLGYTGSRVGILLSLANDDLMLGDLLKAEASANVALSLAETSGKLSARIGTHECLARICRALGNHECAYIHLETVRALEAEIYDTKKSTVRQRKLTTIEIRKMRTEIEVSRRTQAAAERVILDRTRELENAQLDAVTRLAIAAEYRDDETGDHTRRVGRNAAVIAYALGLPLDDCRLLFTAARLHDVGKIGISDLILLKPGKLSEAEFAMMRSHAEIGASILAGASSPMMRMAEQIAACHHERWDGCGYPNGLKDEDIPLAARIVAVADVLDALTSRRPYKDPWPLERALNEIRDNAGGHFDPEVAKAALRAFETCGVPLISSPTWEELLEELETYEGLRHAPIQIEVRVDQQEVRPGGRL